MMRIQALLLALCASCAAVLPEESGPPLLAYRAPSLLGGTWLLELTIPPAQPFAGTYFGALQLADTGGPLVGSVESWSNGARSRFSGCWDGAVVRLERVDVAPFEGFRASFTGALLPGGSLAGTFHNDPSAPHGNGAVGTWRAARLR
jgi:hypothetical protein